MHKYIGIWKSNFYALNSLIRCDRIDSISSRRWKTKKIRNSQITSEHNKKKQTKALLEQWTTNDKYDIIMKRRVE